MRNSVLLLALVLLPLVPAPEAAQRVHPEGGGSPFVGDYQYLIGFPQSDPNIGTVVMSADNGDRIEIQGDGWFSLPSREAGGAGTYVHTDVSGNELERGSWRAVDFVSFMTYEAGSSFGGKLALRIVLTPEGLSAGIPANMQVVSRPGSPSPESAFEARVVIADTGLNFNKWVQGATLIYKIHIDPGP